MAKFFIEKFSISDSIMLAMTSSLFETHLAHSQANSQATVEDMSDAKNKQKTVELLKTF